jgi:tetratricopeptide (TPR) repeat protein
MIQKLKISMLVAAVTATLTMSAQLKVPAPSPTQSLKQSFALSEINIEYSRPSAKGRVVFGDVVPFGKIWRTGANASTKLTFGEDVKIQGTAVPAGTYALYTIPNKDNWEILLYKDLTLGGNVNDYKKENEVARFNVKPKNVSNHVETFLIEVADITPSTANIALNWEKTRVELAVTADIDAKIMKNIETSVINDNRPYFQAATYYYESNKDLNKANEWVDKAIAQNPKAFWMLMLKAKIQAKMNDKKGAVESADKVIALATEAKNDDYVKMAEKLKSENSK